MKDYYQILDVAPDASADEVKKSYRKLARLYHPDYNESDSAHYMFQEIHEAYQTLSDKDARDEYDRLSGSHSERLKAYGDAQKAAENVRRQPFEKTDFEKANPQPKPEANRAQSNRQNDDLQSRLFKKLRENEEENSKKERDKNQLKVSSFQSYRNKAQEFFGKIKNPVKEKSKKNSHASKGKFGRVKSSKRKEGAASLQGEREYLFTITARESVTGTSRELALREEGSGPRLIKVKVPPAINDQAILKIAIDANQSARIRIRIVNDELLERRGLDLTLKLPITIGEAITGADIEIPTPDGVTTVRLPPQNNSKKRLRLKGRGVTDPKTRVKGDLYVKPHIVPPEHRSPTAEQAAKALDEHYNTPVRLSLPKKL